MDDFSLVFSLVDIPFVLGIVFVLQTMKKSFKKDFHQKKIIKKKKIRL